jgi:hypothetical protein
VTPPSLLNRYDNANPLLGVSPEPLEDWMQGLDDMVIPQESEWLVQELLHDVRDLFPGTGFEQASDCE